MTLEEAIYKEETLAYSFGERWKRLGEPVGDLPKLEEEHRQLAEWLLELKKYQRGIKKIKELREGFLQIPLSLEVSILDEVLELLGTESEDKE